MIFEWDESFSVGNDEIDKQHKKWISLYNKLDEVLRSDRQDKLSSIKSEILQEMSEYVDYHFAYEEDYMRSLGFPEAEKHWRQHKNFRTEIYNLCRDHDSGAIILNTEIMDKIKNWFAEHILLQDMKIRDYVNSKDAQK